MNEAFSDIAGEVAKVFAFGETDWLHGYDAFKEEDKSGRYSSFSQ